LKHSILQYCSIFQFIEELESMKRRLEETQSRLLTESVPQQQSSSLALDEHECLQTAPSTLKRRQQQQQDENCNNQQQQQQKRGPNGEPWTEQVKPIISRLKVVEHELQEELNSSMKKQQIIEAQQKRIELLVSANERLMATLTQLKDRYTTADGESQVLNNNHSKISPVLSVSSSMSASSATSSGSPHDEHMDNPGSSSPTASSMSIPRCSSPDQLPPQPNLPAPVLPQQRPNQQNNNEFNLSMKTTEC
jgi:hypothetical protein